MPKVLPSQAALASGSVKESPPSTHVARNNKTWCRAENITSSPYAKPGLSNGHSSKQFVTTQSATSYVRKGRSLVRNPVAVPAFSNGANGLSSTSVYRLNPVNRTETTKSYGSEMKNNIPKLQNGLKTGLEMCPAPKLQDQTRSSNCVSKSSTSPDHSTEGGLSETTLSSIEISKTKDASNVAGADQGEAVANRVMGAKDIIDDGKSKLPTTKKMIYVKHKLNQLVAAHHSESHGQSSNLIEKKHAVPCTKTGQYFKRTKNQLIRNDPLVQSHNKLARVSPDGSMNSEGQGMTKDVSSFKFSRNISRIRDLFPWKRMPYWRKNMASGSSRSSSSLINKKLLHSLKRDSVYTRSTGGFSLRRSKVLSIGGSNLKWSKSIEKRSKKVNEEATIAVAEVEKKKREQKVAFAVGRAKSRNQLSRKSALNSELQSRRPINCSGERVFRIGSVRYKMDSSRRTLQRIPDENPPSGLNQQSGRNSRMSFIPKRLLIGNKEYIRIGNGNQLVRDPKTRIRTLASEKVRWSLHSVRLRLARKQQYCQFFTRFGKCNKEGGKCRFIHDPAKIAVCTKFLKGLCTDTSCKLTHKVIPERMQDCSYFLQGLCTNENCPYRHVNVNPDSSVCEGFLRGYCAEGDECRKKHSYVCPQFESTGECPQGKKCKLHHPSRNMKSRKRKRPEESNLKHIRGRYFGSNMFDADIESGKIASSGPCSEQKKNEDSFFPEGGIMDYISLDVSGSEGDNVEEDESQGGTSNDAMDTSTNLFKEADSLSDHPMLQLDDLDDDDDLIKPIAIMNVPTKGTHTLIEE